MMPENNYSLLLLEFKLNIKKELKLKPKLFFAYFCSIIIKYSWNL